MRLLLTGASGQLGGYLLREIVNVGFPVVAWSGSRTGQLFGVELQPVDLARDFGFSPKELRRIQKLITQHQAEFLEAWHGHLGPGG